MSHYFITPDSVEHRREISAKIWGRDYQFTTANGVFAADRLDLGTSVLFRLVPPVAGTAKILDLGCGYGPIAIGLACANPQAEVYAVDVNERALELAKVNAKKYGVGEQVHVCLPEEVDPSIQFDEIWSNPPIRVGKDVLHDLLETWLARLSPVGVCWLVVGKNLGADSLQAWLSGNGFVTSRHGSAKGFRVLKVAGKPSG